MRLAVLLSVALGACAGHDALNAARATSNTAGRLLTLIDAEVAARYSAARMDTAKRFPVDDPAGYAAAMAHANVWADALDLAWREHGLLHVALQLAEDVESERLWREATACLADALDVLGRVLMHRWRDELATVSAGARMASGGTCPRSVGVQ